MSNTINTGRAAMTSIGGENLFRDPSFNMHEPKEVWGFGQWNTGEGQFDRGVYDDSDERFVVKLFPNPGGRGSLLSQQRVDLTKYPATSYTASGWFYAPQEGIYGRIDYNNTHLPNFARVCGSRTPLKKGWNFLSCTYTPAPDDAALDAMIICYRISLNVADTPEGAYVYIWHPKLEVGDVATAWSPAITDYLGPANIWTTANMHRNIFRGIRLGNTFTDAQKAAIAAGTFDDLYIGDYWVMNGRTWRIVDFDYWYGQGDTPCTKHHVVVMPDAQLYTHNMNTDNTTTGGYALSDMYTDGLTQAKEIVETDFGANILDHRTLLCNATASGHPSGYIWTGSTVELCTEWQMFGSPVYAALNNGTTVPMLYSIDQKQFALMQMVPFYINPSRQWFWLRDVVSSTLFSSVAVNGSAHGQNASAGAGVRPAFGLVGA